MDALGHPALVETGLASLRPLGTHIQVGLMESEHSAISINKLTGKELKIIGSHGMQASRYPQMFELIASGACDPSQLISGVVSLEQAPAILTRMDSEPPMGVAVIDFAVA